MENVSNTLLLAPSCLNEAARLLFQSIDYIFAPASNNKIFDLTLSFIKILYKVFDKLYNIIPSLNCSILTVYFLAKIFNSRLARSFSAHKHDKYMYVTAYKVQSTLLPFKVLNVFVCKEFFYSEYYETYTTTCD